MSYYCLGCHLGTMHEHNANCEKELERKEMEKCNNSSKYRMRLEIVLNMCEEFHNRYANSSDGRYSLLRKLLISGWEESEDDLIFRQRIVASVAQFWHDSLPNSTCGRYGSIARALRE